MYGNFLVPVDSLYKAKENEKVLTIYGKRMLCNNPNAFKRYMDLYDTYETIVEGSNINVYPPINDLKIELFPSSERDVLTKKLQRFLDSGLDKLLKQMSSAYAEKLKKYGSNFAGFQIFDLHQKCWKTSALASVCMDLLKRIEERDFKYYFDLELAFCDGFKHEARNMADTASYVMNFLLHKQTFMLNEMADKCFVNESGLYKRITENTEKIRNNKLSDNERINAFMAVMSDDPFFDKFNIYAEITEACGDPENGISQWLDLIISTSEKQSVYNTPLSKYIDKQFELGESLSEDELKNARKELTDRLNRYGLSDSPKLTKIKKALETLENGGGEGNGKVNLSKIQSSESKSAHTSSSESSDDAPKTAVEKIGYGCGVIIGIAILVAFGIGCINCLGCSGGNSANTESLIESVSGSSFVSPVSSSKSDYFVESSILEYSEPESSATPDPANDANDVVLAVSNLLNAIKDRDETTASSLIINSERLQRLSYLYRTLEKTVDNYDSESRRYMAKELIRLASGFEYTVGTPVLDKNIKLASVDIRLTNYDMNQIFDYSSQLIEDMVNGTSHVVDSDTAKNLYDQTLIYIEDNYGSDNSRDYSEDEMIEIFYVSVIQYCDESNFFEGKIDDVSITYTLTFEYLDGGWKLSGIDNYASFVASLSAGNFNQY